ncbi:helix-turn-helix domain-containing protein [Acidaminobacter sp. JC074]|uniref:AraC family transcriptional regulator n=1 Tax=Acidaminobacter sp. JC074 TaxID=2530199 RepID=UPI001F111213|nr:AraC family transcriptional regulator [Acidaminobacter sp. JC074]MCH4887775.1 helix-turn-helix domain-containing protein [Acidaminobacter sp. JC074]
MRLLCEVRSYQPTADTHFHNYSQLILPIKGRLSIETDENQLTLDPNHMFLLPPDTSHSFYSNTSNKFLVVDIPNDISHILIGETIRQEQYKRLDERWKAIKYLISEEAKRSNVKALEKLLSYAFDYLRNEEVPASVAYIHEHFDENLTIAELAMIENYHVNHYVQWFSKKMGMTPNIYIQKVRLEHAKRYLKSTDYDLLMISNLVGYEHQSSLTRLFKNHGLMSPSKYRQIVRNKDKKKIILDK